ncbi:uncharacterized protein LOC131844952 [Achroia grisella]|uniref:uncharacterized protein LOC131842810 n=1 Tax=Achroia grisella TaxID=688607 RepID=UPI0027D206F3|nr:uncharacterized protein LOC131842810 [Achroia grisella]XP_059049929.1 uncharacterized protein LOC131844952 [Achroia grisella]
MGYTSICVTIFVVLYISATSGTDLNLGTTVNGQLAYVENVKLSSFPLKVRTKNVFYNDEQNPKVIKGISAVDLLRGNASATITAGGVGTTFANIRLKSERGEGLDYQVQVFV